MYRQRERRREGGTEGRSTPGPQCSAPNADIPSVAPSNSDGRMDGRWTDGRGRTLLKCEISDRAGHPARRPGERTMTDRLAPEKGALIFLPPTDLIETS